MRQTARQRILVGAVAALLLWRLRGKIARGWGNFRTFSAPSPGLYDALVSRALTGTYEGMADEIASAIPGGSILDVGCGPGRLTSRIAALGPQYSVTGIDISPDMVSLARENATKTDPQPAARFQAGDVQALPFGDESFDLITSSLSLHHWPDPAMGLREIHRVLKSGGQARIYDVPAWFGHLETKIPAHGELITASPFEAGTVEPFRKVGPVTVLVRLVLRKQG